MTRVVILAGGTGGAKLAAGLAAVLPAGALTVIANTGDDIERHGLLVMPDHDAILYMLGDRFDHVRGWGIAGETWTVMDELKAYGEEGWFGLGDRDFATHIARTARIRAGATLTEAVLALQAAAGLATRILPMSDDAVRTQVLTDDGWLDFQEYFVHRHQDPEVREVRFEGIEASRPTDAVLAALDEADLIVIGPSNPIVSLGPILAVPGMVEAIADARRRGAPVMTVSGIIGGKALKGPADRMLVSLGHDASARRRRRDPGPSHGHLRIGRRRRRPGARDRRPRRRDARHRHDHGRRERPSQACERSARARQRPGADVTESRRIAAIIPVASIEGAKTRLGETLDAEERHDLVSGLLERTLDAVTGAASIADVLVVSPDRDVLTAAAAAGARTFRQRGSGLNAGIRDGRDDTIAGGADAIVVVPLDLPFITAAALETVVAALTGGEGPTVLVVPDRHGSGTNVLGLRPPDRHRRVVRDRESRGAPDGRSGRGRHLHRAGRAAHGGPRHARRPRVHRSAPKRRRPCRLTAPSRSLPCPASRRSPRVRTWPRSSETPSTARPAQRRSPRPTSWS